MPIAYEVAILALVAYGVGLALGWALWGRATTMEMAEEEGI